jgi:hypothetical protein
MSVFKWATKTRQILDNAELPDTVSFYNICGTSYETPYDVWWVLWNYDGSWYSHHVVFISALDFYSDIHHSYFELSVAL